MKIYTYVTLALSIFLVGATQVMAAKPTSSGFDEFGYNYKARIFSGLADGVDKTLDGAVWGDTTYAKDHLVMKWNDEWDRGKADNWAYPPYNAWENNEWNGMKGGSGEVWHYKIVWVGPCTEGEEFEGGGYCLWNQFKVLSDHGKDADGHTWLAHAVPTGYGAYRWNQVDSFTVPADSVSGVMSNVTLNSDSKYLVKVSGTAFAGDGIEFDADYSFRTPTSSVWTDEVSTYEYLTGLLDLQVDGSSVNWGALDDVNHQYFYYMPGTGSPVNLKVYDTYPSNNTGYLTVTIYEQN